MTTLLVLTVGQTDVQMVVDHVRRELSKRRCAALHDELLERGAKSWRLVDTPDAKGDSLDELPAGELALCTPKLDAVLRCVGEQKLSPTAALVLETRRDAKAASSDPRAAGTVLEARLKMKGIDAVYRRSYLEGNERLEDRNQPRDAVVRREIVRRIERAVRECLRKTEPTRVFVAATGGFPVICNLVEEIVQLHAPVPVDIREVADGAKANPPTADRAVPRTSVPDPIASFQARRRALKLISKGNILGAWAIAEPLDADETENRWTRVVEWLKRFASSLPMPEACDISVLTHPQMAVRAALRVELALRASDIPRAIHGTVAFFEAALWDGLNKRVERSSDPARRRYYRIKTGEPPSGNKLLRQGDGSKEDRKCPFEHKDTTDGTDWYWIYDGDGGPAARLAKRFLKRCGLVAFDKALGSEIRALRNDVAHNEPTPEFMNDARAKMQKARLWPDTDTFLSQALVQNVLCELDEENPKMLCEDLIALVRDRLLGHDLASGPE